MQQLEQIQNRIETEGPFCITDPDSKNMLVNNGGHDISYNVQIAVEPTSHIVLAVDTTNEVTDYKQLHRMAKQAKEVFGSEQHTVVVDRGYYSTSEFVKCIKDGISPIVPKPLRGNGIMSKYLKYNFVYDQESDTYVCPQGKALSRLRSLPERREDIAIYQNTLTCKAYPELKSCTRTSARRRIVRRPDDAAADAVDLRTKNHKDMVHLRKCMVEHCFGAVKRMFGFSYFLTRGLENVSTKFIMHFLVYNIKRVLNTLGTERIRKALVV